MNTSSINETQKVFADAVIEKNESDQYDINTQQEH